MHDFLGLLLMGASAATNSILFIGNSFTFAGGSTAQTYLASSVTDLNHEPIGGIPALFKSFATQLNLKYDVYLETHPGVGLDWHLAYKRDVIEQKTWNNVVMQGYSTLDENRPGNPAVLVDSARQMAALLRSKNPEIKLRLMATWPRADQVYDAKGAWFGKSIETMASDVRGGYNMAAAAIGNVNTAILPVGESWLRAIHAGLAVANPYRRNVGGRMNLWSSDHYHASVYGSYLESLVIFGGVTGLDPRLLGRNERSGIDFGLSHKQIADLEQVAFEQLTAEGLVTAQPAVKPP